MLRAADLTPELVDAATEALLMSHRKFSETRLEAMRFTRNDGTPGGLSRKTRPVNCPVKGGYMTHWGACPP